MHLSATRFSDRFDFAIGKIVSGALFFVELTKKNVYVILPFSSLSNEMPAFPRGCADTDRRLAMVQLVAIITHFEKV